MSIRPALDFSLRTRTAVANAAEAFEKALADPATNEVLLPADGWRGLVAIAATYAAMGVEDRTPASSELVSAQAQGEFRKSLDIVLSHSDAEIAAASSIPEYTVRYDANGEHA